MFLPSDYTELTFLMVEYDFSFLFFLIEFKSFNLSSWTAFRKWWKVHILISIRQIAFNKKIIVKLAIKQAIPFIESVG